MTEASRNVQAGGDGGEPESLWTVRQAAKFLQVSSDTIYRLCAAGKIPHAKLGGVYRFSPARLRLHAERLHAENDPGSNVVRLSPRGRR